MIMAKKVKRMVVVTTDKDRRGVFFGQLFQEEDDVVVLKNARMAIYWSSETHGVTGLASIGPQKGSRISPKIPQIKLNGITSVMDCSEKAIKQWEAEIWD